MFVVVLIKLCSKRQNLQRKFENIWITAGSVKMQIFNWQKSLIGMELGKKKGLDQMNGSYLGPQI